MKKYFVSDAQSYGDYSGNTVNRHIENFLTEQGYQPLNYKWKNKIHIFYRLLRIIQVLYWSLSIGKGSIVFFHFPIQQRATRFFLHLLNCNQVITVALIHDFNGLRFGQGNVFELEKKSIKNFMHVIVHNSNMKKLVSTFYPIDQTSILWLFDYYCPSTIFSKPSFSFDCIIAANMKKVNYLNDHISKFITENKSIKLHIYGNVSSTQQKNFSHENIKVYGPRHPDLLPLQLNGAFGIVWDGDSISTCTGSLGKYLRYNTPHKLSLYLAAGIPVIVWAQSAMSEWVEMNKVGFTIESWYELENKLQMFEWETYKNLQVNAQKIGNLLRKGSYIKEVTVAIERKYDI